MRRKLFSIHWRKLEINSIVCGLRIDRFDTIHDVYYDGVSVRSDASKDLLVTVDFFVIEMKLVIPGKFYQVDVETEP